MSDDSIELTTRVTYAMLRPAARLALTAGISLRDMKKYIELAYYHEARNDGLRMRDVSEILSISMAKVGLLSKALKEHFIAPELEHGIARQILSLLWATALTESRIAQALPAFDDTEVAHALATLVEEGRVNALSGRTVRYELAAGAHRLETHPTLAKLDGLNTLLASVSRTVEARFFDQDDRANVRNLAFRARPEDLNKLKELYETQLFPLIVELDNAVETEADSVPMKLSILWTVDGNDGENNE